MTQSDTPTKISWLHEHGNQMEKVLIKIYSTRLQQIKEVFRIRKVIKHYLT